MAQPTAMRRPSTRSSTASAASAHQSPDRTLRVTHRETVAVDRHAEVPGGTGRSGAGRSGCCTLVLHCFRRFRTGDPFACKVQPVLRTMHVGGSKLELVPG
jgi:hypothetical protein